MHCLDPKSGLNVNTVIRTNRLVTADTWHCKVILSSYSVQRLLFKLKRDFIEIACKVESYSWHSIYLLFRCIYMNNWRIHTSAIGFITSVPVISPVFLPRVVLQLNPRGLLTFYKRQNSWTCFKMQLMPGVHTCTRSIPRISDWPQRSSDRDPACLHVW